MLYVQFGKTIFKLNKSDKELSHDIEKSLGIPSEQQMVFYKGKKLPSFITFPDSLLKKLKMPLILNLSCKINGGKGGFGSLLKQQQSNFRTTNFNSMRDLNGRRLRHVRQEQQLTHYVPPTPERRSEIQKDFEQIKQTGRQRQLRNCYFGDSCKYKHKCRYVHPGDDAKSENKADSKTEKELRHNQSMKKASKNLEASMKFALKAIAKRKISDKKSIQKPKSKKLIERQI
ncbi:hypothetical protein MHBO_000783 [Bonamia ostreae]|uniref:SDE2-like domain-containing protein n=1 Tax=Bonamia ostreae TaxID=126728 RepID=A0ABV2AGT2_9EUKA